MLNKNLWDYFLGAVPKLLYYGIVLYGAIMHVIHLKRKDLRLLGTFLIYVLIVLTIGLIKSNSEQFSMGVMEYIVYPLPFLALSYYFDPSNRYEYIFNGIFKWGIITSFLAIYEYIKKESILPNGSSNITIFYDGTRSFRSGVFIGSPMILAVVLGMVLIYAVYKNYVTKNKKYLIGAFFILVGILCTGSRAPLVGTICGIIFMYFYLYRMGYTSRKIAFYIFMIGFGTFIIICAFTLFPNIQTGISFLDYTINRFSSTFNFTSEWGNLERLARWTYYINVFLHNPLVGIGIATTSAEVASNVSVTDHGITTESGLIARLVETGLAGTITYYSFFIVIVKKAVFSMRENVKNQTFWQVYSTGIIVLFCVEDLVLQISLDIFASFILWFVLAYTINLLQADTFDSDKMV